MKRMVLCLSVLLCALFLTVGVAAEDGQLLYDAADLLTDEEEWDLESRLQEIRSTLQADVVIVTWGSLRGADAQSFADDFYDYGSPYGGWTYGEDGVLFLLAMEERQWAVSTSGMGITAFTEDALDWVEYAVIPLLSKGEYYDAFTEFTSLAEAYFTAAVEWEKNPDVDWVDPYYPGTDIQYEYYDNPEITVRRFGTEWIGIALILGFLIALIPMGVLKSQLNTVHMQTGAVPYQKSAGVRITDAKDLYLYRNVTKKPIPRNDPPRSGGHRPGGSIHMGSSGRSHGGRSGGF